MRLITIEWAWTALGNFLVGSVVVAGIVASDSVGDMVVLSFMLAILMVSFAVAVVATYLSAKADQ